MALQVWLLNPYQIQYPWQELCLQVKSLLKPVVDKRDASAKTKTKFGDVNVYSRFTKPTVGADDLAVYVVPVKNFGFVGVGFGSSGRPHNAAGLTTYSGNQVCSEIYLGEEVSANSPGEVIKVERMTNDIKGVRVKKRFSTRLAANLIFHELQHNVTPNWDENKLHGISDVSIGKESVGENSMQSEKDVKIIAENVDVGKQRQWTGAWEWLTSNGWAPQ